MQRSARQPSPPTFINNRKENESTNLPTNKQVPELTTNKHDQWKIKAHQLATVVLAQQKQIIAIKTSSMPDDWKEDYEAKKKALQKAAKAARAEVLHLRERIAQLENHQDTTDATTRDAYSIREDYGAQKALIIALEQLRVSQLTISDLQSQVSNLQAQLTLTRQALEAKDVEISVMNRESGLDSPTVSSSSAAAAGVDDNNKDERMMVLTTEAARHELNASCDEISLLKGMLQEREEDIKKDISEKEPCVALNIKGSSSRDIAVDKGMVDKKKKENDASKKKRRPNILGRICFIGTVIAATVVAAIHHK